LRNALAFTEAKKKNTAGAYKNFLSVIPKQGRNDAISHYEERVYKEATAANTIAS